MSICQHIIDIVMLIYCEFGILKSNMLRQNDFILSRNKLKSIGKNVPQCSLLYAIFYEVYSPHGK